MRFVLFLIFLGSLVLSCNDDKVSNVHEATPGKVDTAESGDADTDADADSDTDTDTDADPPTCEEQCGMELAVRLREEWGVPILTQNESVDFDWGEPSEVAEGIVSGFWPPVPDFPNVDVYPDAYNAATEILNDTYGWNWCCSVLDWAAEYHTPEYVTVHHTAGDFGTCDQYIQYVYDFHTFGQDHGWGDAGYQIIVCEDEPGVVTVYEGRYSGSTDLGRDPFSSIYVIGAHVSDHNTGNVGISLVGDFTSTAPDDAQFETYSRVVARVFYEAGLTDTSVLQGHRDWSGASTDCPGDQFYPLIPELQERIDYCQSECGIVPPSAFGPRAPNATLSSHEYLGENH